MSGELQESIGLTVLVVDDEPTICALCQEVISHGIPGAVIIAAKDGQEAISCAQAYHPDVIVMDLAIPVLDGLAATRALKADRDTASIPVIAFTGRVWDTQGVLDAGCAAFLTKPCSAQKLLATLTQVLEHRGGLRSCRNGIM
jgi:two-component system cell cycle response regulator DivK